MSLASGPPPSPATAQIVLSSNCVLHYATIINFVLYTISSSFNNYGQNALCLQNVYLLLKLNSDVTYAHVTVTIIVTDTSYVLVSKEKSYIENIFRCS